MTELTDQQKLDEIRKNENLFQIESQKKKRVWVQKIAPLISEDVFESLDRGFDTLGTAADDIGRLGERGAALLDAFQYVSTATHSIALGAAAINFVRIPIVVLLNLMVNGKVERIQSKMAKFIYSGLVLSLLILAFIFPTVGAFLLIAAGAIAVGTSVFLMGKLFFDKLQTSRKLKQVDSALELALKAMEGIIDEAKGLKQPPESTTVNDLYLRYEAEREKIKKLYQTQQTLEKRQKEYKGILPVIDRTMGVFMASLSLISLVIGLYFPPVGLGILIGAAALGVLYFSVRFIIPQVIKLGRWLGSKWGKQKQIEEIAPQAEHLLQPNADNKLSFPKEQISVETPKNHPFLLDEALMHGGLEKKPKLVKQSEDDDDEGEGAHP